MKNMTLPKIAQACGGTLYWPEKACNEKRRKEEQEASGVVLDSRLVEPGGIFIATKGERADGHDFIFQMGEKKALGVICERAIQDCPVPYILVEDSFKALREIAEFYRKQLQIQVVGITGSVGKTSTKELIAGVLSAKYQVLKTKGNFNNEVGLPLTVLSIREEHEIAVLEMGISDFGEMHRLSKIARPDICVMTNIGQSHLENLGTREGILKAKSEIFDFMNPEGSVFLNGDDDLLRLIDKKGTYKPVHFGLNAANEIYASNVTDLGLFGSRAVVHAKTGRTPMEVFPVEIPLPGEHMVLNALAAVGVGIQLGLTTEEIRKGLTMVERVQGRSNVITLPSFTLIDDCYNANPASMHAAIDLLAHAKSRKAAVLGDMFELGERQEELHGEVGAYAVEKKIDVLICVGLLSRQMYESALETAKESGVPEREIFYFETREEMMEELPEIICQGDTILVKASHRMGFEKVVESLISSGNSAL